MNNLIADTTIAPVGGFTGFGPLGSPQGTGIFQFVGFISKVVGVMTIVAIIWFVFVLITGAISFISSGGDKQKLEAARSKITSGIIGLIITISALFIIGLIGTFLGVNLLDIGTLFGNIVK